MILTILLAVLAASTLLAAGFILGVKQGANDRELLHLELHALQGEDAESSMDLSNPTVEFSKNILPNRPKLELVTTPAAVDETLDLQSLAVHRGDLAHLMRESAEQFGFKTVVLCDQNGFPLASSPNYVDLGRLAAISGFVVIFGERIRRENDFMPVSLMFHDNNQNVIVSRIFTAGNQRLVLTAVSNDKTLRINSLDTIFPKVINLLFPELE